MSTLPDTTRGAPYDPTTYGALCPSCALQHEPMCTPELRPRFKLLVVAEAPGKNEVILDRPLVGRSGKETDRVLSAAGFSREDCSFSNAILCRPPGNNLKALLAQTRKKNRKLKIPLFMPAQACFPRLLFELYHADNVLLMGSTAWQALYKERGGSKFSKSRGFPDKIELPYLKGFKPKTINVLTTVHPAFVLRNRRWTIPFESDVKKTSRMVAGTLSYHEPEMLFFPKPDQLANFLQIHKEHLAYDWESNGTEALTAEPWCVGIGNDRHVTCVPFASVERPKVQYYTQREQNQVEHILNDFYRDESGYIYAHHGKYDRQLWESNFKWFKMGRREFDTIIAHHVIHSEWPHDLGFLSAQFSDAGKHKDVNHDAWDSDYELHKYCMYDVAQTSLAAQKMLVNPLLHEMKDAFNNDMFLSEFCRQMHKIGVQLDTEERDRHYAKLNGTMDTKRQEVRSCAAKAIESHKTSGKAELARTINPGSTQQVARFLFDVCGLPTVPEDMGGLTDAGEPSVGKDQLFYLIDQGLPDELETLLYALIDYKEAQTLRGHCTIEPGFDRRVHANWNPHVVVSGRLSCSGPNLMNLRKWLRSMYVPAPGNAFITCDKAQLEARVQAVLCGDTPRIEAFLAGADIHKVNALGVLGRKRVEDVTDDERQFTKTFVYAVQYLAGKKTAHRMIKNFVNPKTGERPYRTIPYAQVSRSHDQFWIDRAVNKQWHEDNRELQARIGYLQDVIHGRRRYFLDGGGDENKEELANFIIQSSAAADVNNATKRVVDRFPWGFDGPNTGLVHQCHDSLTLECREEHAMKIGREMQKIMYSELQGMPLPVDLSIGKDLYNQKEIK